MEATGSYGIDLLYHLAGAGYTAALLNPRHVRNFGLSLGRRVKTDKVDAEIIARFIQSVEPRNWTTPPLEISELQSLVRRREQLVTSKQAASNRLAALHRSTAVAAVAQTWSSDSLKREIEFLSSEIATIAREIDELLKRSVSLKKAFTLLRSIPGVGKVVASTILAEVPCLTAFGRAREVAAFVGLTPSLKSSGTSVRRRGHLTKEGSGILRKHLYMAALNVVQRDNPLQPGYRGMVERGKPKMVALCALMHKLLRIAYGVLKHETPFTEKFVH